MLSALEVPGKGTASPAVENGYDSPAPDLLSPMAGREKFVDVPWLVHAIAASTPVAVTMAFYNGTLFSLHVAAMAFTFLLVLPEGIILAVRAGRHKNRPRLMRTHMALQLSCLVLSMAGLAAQFWHRQSQGKRHFEGLHAWLGVATLLGTQIVSLVGLLLFYVVPKARRALMPRVLATHQVGGRLVFILAVATILEALKIFDSHHRRHLGLTTYLMASAVVAQAVGMHGVLWPGSSIIPLALRSPGRDRLSGASVERKPLLVVVDREMEEEQTEKKEKD